MLPLRRSALLALFAPLSGPALGQAMTIEEPRRSCIGERALPLRNPPDQEILV